MFEYNLTRITGVLHGDICKFMAMSPSILLRMKNVFRQIYKYNQNTHFMLINFFSPNSYRLLDDLGKYGAARQTTDDSVVKV